MFRDKVAWFSNSVCERVHNFWVSEDGLIDTWKVADYLFSDDAMCSDTKRIFDSSDYANGRATVFHSAFLSACQVRQSTKSVPIGHYVLPPISVQREMKAVTGRFIWERDLSQEGSNGQIIESKVTKAEPCHHNNTGCTQRAKTSRQEECMMSIPERDGSACCEVAHYPVNNMISGYISVDRLRRYSGELHDIQPSHLGHQVSKSRCRKLL